MFGSVKKLAKKVVYGYKADSNSYIDFCRRGGQLLENGVCCMIR